MLKKFTKLIIAGLVLSMGTAMAQKGVEDGSKYGHGEDSIRCLENLSLYKEYYKQKNYKEAYPFWTVAFNECPASNMGIYSDGEKMLISFYEKEKDAAKKEEYYQLLMKTFDQRIQLFGTHKKYPTPYIEGKKAIAILKLKGNNAAAMKEAQTLLEGSVEKLGAKSQTGILLTYMASSVSMFKSDNMTAEALVNVYTELTGLFDQKIARSKKPEKLNDAKGKVEALFANSGAATCDVLESIFAPQITEHKADLDWLKRVNRLLAKGDCTESDLFYKSSEYLHAIEPSSSSAFGLAKMYLKSKDLDKAIGYYNEAIELETDNVDKAKYHYQLGLVLLSQNKFSQARANARQAISLDTKAGAPYILIGKAYAASASSFGADEFAHATVYWAAVDKFYQAKSVDPSVAAEAQKLINSYSQYFPNTEMVFFQNLTEGAAYKVEGWIGETTTVRAKK